MITSSILLFYSYYADICKISNFRNFSRKFYFEPKYLENGLADFSDIYISFFRISTALSYETNSVKPLQLTLKNENPMWEHPAHQVNVSRIGILCTPDSSKFFGTPCIVAGVSTPNFTLV